MFRESFEHLEFLHEIERRAEVNLGRSSLPPPEMRIHVDNPFVPPPEMGEGELRERVSEIWGVERDEVLITAGTSEANLLSMLLLKERVERVWIETPVYYPLRALPEFFSMKINYLRRGEDLVLDLSQVKGGDGVILSNLNNPLGVPLRGEVKRLRELVEEGAYVLADEVYSRFNPSFHGALASSLPNTISTSSLSKSAGCVGLRVGWLISDREMVKDALRLKNLFGYMVSGVSQKISRDVIEVEEEHIERHRKRLRSNYNYLRVWGEKWGFSTSGGGVSPISFLFTPGFSDTRGIAKRLLDERGVGVLPGEVFGRSGGFRIYLGGRKRDLETFMMAAEDVMALGKTF